MERRNALKEKFNNAPSSLTDSELTELLLLYSENKDEAKDIAGRLMTAFGSARGAAAASRPALKGAGACDNTAILLSLCTDIERQINADSSKSIKQLNNTDDAIRLCKGLLCTEQVEKMLLVTLDKSGKIIDRHTLNVLGTVSTITVNPQELVKFAIFDNAYSAIIAHNHPHGVASASKDDVKFTLNATALFREIGVLLLDHIIVGEGSAVSMKSKAEYRGYFE